jgi:MFS transporter, UMF1 family
MSQPPDQTPPRPGTNAQRVSWVLYDWANSGFVLILLGPLFSPYFIGELLPKQVGSDGTTTTGLVLFGSYITGSAVFAVLTSIVALLITLTAPPLGALADMRGWTKRLFLITAVAGAIIGSMCGFLTPGAWVLAAIIYILSAWLLETSCSFYNAFLPAIEEPQRQGRLSGYGFGLGYVGGAIALVIAGFVLEGYFGLSRAIALTFGSAWWIVFAIPAFLTLREFKQPDPDAPTSRLITSSFKRVGETLRNVRQYRMLFLFLIAFLLFNNGITTAIYLAAPFAEDVLHLTASQQITSFLLVQMVAMVGAFGFGHLSDRIGQRNTIVITLIIWCVAVSLTMLVQSYVQYLWVAGLIGVVLGGSQSASRTLLAKLAPAEIRNEAFGLFALSGRAVSIFGPLAYAGAAWAFGARYGVAAVLPFFVVGLLLMLRVKEPQTAPAASL